MQYIFKIFPCTSSRERVAEKRKKAFTSLLIATKSLTFAETTQKLFPGLKVKILKMNLKSKLSLFYLIFWDAKTDMAQKNAH